MSRNRSEDNLQKGIVQFLFIMERQRRLAALWFHVPNGGFRSVIEARIFKGLGVHAGVADLVFLWGTGCACMEVKAKDGRQSPAQREFEANCARLGIPYAVVRDIDDAERALKAWGVVLPFDASGAEP